MFSRIVVLLGTVLLLGACAYAFDKSIQPLTIETPGAYNADCYAYVEGIRYRFRPPETVMIGKSKKNMTVDCYAPGNRHRKVVIKPSTSENAHLNVATGIVPGMAWDALSGAFYEYPEAIFVDFTNMPVTAEKLPAQNKLDIKQPEEYDLEEFKPGIPHMRSDRTESAIEIERRKPQPPVFGLYQTQQPAAATQAVASPSAVSKPATKTEAAPAAAKPALVAVKPAAPAPAAPKPQTTEPAPAAPKASVPAAPAATAQPAQKAPAKE